jgi:hypothetical protein
MSISQTEQRADAEERAWVAALPADQRAHYELNDGTCVTCGEPWICERGLATW